MEPREQSIDDGRADATAERLWQFATRQYADAAVAEACLRAQDELAMDVNLILYAAWRASEGDALSVGDLAGLAARCRDWRDAVVLPLRRLRRRWKQSAPGDFEYAAIKALELLAEKKQLELLARSAGQVNRGEAVDGRPAQAPSRSLLTHNLQALCRHYGVDEDALRALNAALDALRAERSRRP